jgi:hypothetical protein
MMAKSSRLDSGVKQPMRVGPQISAVGGGIIAMWALVSCSTLNAGSQKSLSVAQAKAPIVRLTAPKVFNERCEIKIEFTNPTDKKIEISETFLPWWRGRLSLLLVDTAMVPRVLKEEMFLDDPRGGTTVRIAPNTSVSGTMEISHLFPEFWAKLEDSDLILYWSYQGHLVDRTALERCAGAVIIPQQKK